MQQSITERGPCLPRTLDNIDEHYKLFVNDGAKQSRAKEISYSVVSRPLVQIETDHVSKCFNVVHINACVN